MIHKFLSYLNLNNVGAFELFLALYPIMSGYSWGFLRGDWLFVLLLAIWALQNQRIIKVNFKWLKILIGFVFLHEIILMFIIPVQISFINNTLSIILISSSIIPIARRIDYHKFVGSLNLIAIICILGLLYQSAMVISGMSIHPIKLPFLPDMESGTRLYEESIRPSSFFWEPAAFVTFLIIPLFVSLHERKYLWSLTLTFSMFLSTSSTGIILSMTLLVIYIFTQKIKNYLRIVLIVLGIGMLYSLTHSSLFEAGVEKIEQTDPEKNSRIMNGFLLYDKMSDNEILLGIPAANINEYYSNNGGFIFFNQDGSIFIPAFWLTLAKYGLIGLFLYLKVYMSIWRKDPTTSPYISILFLAMFFQVASNFGTNMFLFQLVFLYSYVSQRIKNTNIQTHIVIK